MKRLIAVALLIASSSSLAASYKVVLAPPAGGSVLKGHGGLHAVDDRSPTSLVRIVSPGSDVKERGTIRVLVMNLGTRTFPFGPEQVSLQLADGTKLSPVPLSEFIKSADLIEREMGRARVTDMRNRSNFGALAQQSGGLSAQSNVPVPGGGASPVSSSVTSDSYDHRADEMLLPGAKTLDSIYQVLESQPVDPNKAWGGYYVFNLPKRLRAVKGDQPLTIVVRTGAEVHRFNATLRYE
jgi:hypothetical protein